MNNFKFSNDNKRYHTWNYYLRNRYNSKVYKVPLDGGFTCPNRDGSVSYGGCSFCSERGSGDFVFESQSIIEQYLNGKEVMMKKWPNAKVIPYFQSYSNTYGSLDKIKSCIDPFLKLDEVVAISIGTRPDCLEDFKLNYLDKCSKEKDIWIELGLQSANDNTTSKLNRGHDFNCLKECIERIKKTNCKICIHIINGLPNENKQDMIDTAKKVNDLNIDAIKIHMLHIIKNTALANEYLLNPFKIITREEYVDIVCEQLKVLNPNIVIQRLTGDANKDDLITPKWTIKKTIVLNEIDKTMSKNNWFQGINLSTK
ncbi:MAG: TIGR01212 family radical SAM protein [Anaerorhabdus sp.]